MATQQDNFRVRYGLDVGNKINAATGTTAYASLNIPHGNAPTTPTNGDMWTTTAGIYVRINGTTVGPLGAGGGGGVTVSDTEPVSPAADDLWWDSTIGVMFIYYDSTWVEVGGGVGPAGPAGADGAAGAAGVGVPTGGATGAFLKKNSVTDYDTSFAVLAAADIPGTLNGTFFDGSVTSTSLSVQATSGAPTAEILSEQAAGYNPPTIVMRRVGSVGGSTPNSSSVGLVNFNGKSTGLLGFTAAAIESNVGTVGASDAPGQLIFSTNSGSGLGTALTIAADKQVTLVGKALLATGSTTLAPIQFVAGPVLTTAAAGVMEFTGDAFYATPNSAAVGGRGFINASHWYGLTAARTLTNGTGAQSIFGVSLTVAASTTYEIEMEVAISSSGTTTAIKSLSFGGTATLTSIGYQVFYTHSATSVATTGASNNLWVATAAATAMGATGTTNYSRYKVKGLVRVNASGTFTPQITWSAAPGAAPSVVINSYVKMTPLGTNTTTTVGAWA